MKSIISLLIFISLTNYSYSQEICLKLDSIECYRIPWHLKSNFDIYKNEIILGESFSKWQVKNIITDKKALDYFLETNFIDTSKILVSKKSPNDIDARAVLILNYSNGLKDTLIFNGNSSYYYRQKVYLSNIKILMWLVQYNPLADPNKEFINPKDISTLRQKYNFMIE